MSAAPSPTISDAPAKVGDPTQTVLVSRTLRMKVKREAYRWLNAASALGYVAGWVTGWRTYSPRVTAAFCAPGERIAGFIYIGHPAAPLMERARPDLGSLITLF